MKQREDRLSVMIGLLVGLVFNGLNGQQLNVPETVETYELEQKRVEEYRSARRAAGSAEQQAIDFSTALKNNKNIPLQLSGLSNSEKRAWQNYYETVAKNLEKAMRVQEVEDILKITPVEVTEALKRYPGLGKPRLFKEIEFLRDKVGIKGISTDLSKLNQLTLLNLTAKELPGITANKIKTSYDNFVKSIPVEVRDMIKATQAFAISSAISLMSKATRGKITLEYQQKGAYTGTFADVNNAFNNLKNYIRYKRQGLSSQEARKRMAEDEIARRQTAEEAKRVVVAAEEEAIKKRENAIKELEAAEAARKEISEDIKKGGVSTSAQFRDAISREEKAIAALGAADKAIALSKLKPSIPQRARTVVTGAVGRVMPGRRK